MMANGLHEFPWYEVAQGDSLEQGDILPGIEVTIPYRGAQTDQQSTEVAIDTVDVVVMTQTCDIAQGKIESFLLCPLKSLQDFVNASPDFGSDLRESLRRGNLPSLHLLNEYSGEVEFPISVVDFREVYSAPRWLLAAHANSVGPRLRLMPPYKEHLAQAFAKFFMRVALPVEIDRNKVKQCSSDRGKTGN